ncbi:MAG: hypothetical protein HY782_11180 [Chloroflexi bacterium]|nr:hypothetical protein [Chloroflexota bacterium]
MPVEKTIPAFVIRISYDIIKEETPNRAALNRVLEMAGLERYADSPPPMDDSPAISRAEFERMIGVVWQVFDDVQARLIFRRTGQRGFEHLTRSGVLSFTQFLRAFDSLTSKTERVALAMQRLTGEISRALGNRHEFHRDGEDFILDIYDCPYCSDLARQGAHTSDAHICYIPVAFYEAAVNWASGDKNTVREIACAAGMRQSYCRFKIFWNLGVKDLA